ncbi:response regulator [Simiduia sp. 21SJ11W-1]|uniref:response regulator n=1 Tax=Simiduia sp. 21SJ11W-1 TaxID=2909669 RepID=UPI00209CE85C|nr:response regulator [Simiduia sp. 21SJ11W-1]UTA48684.1 response regulator [Simiduia sp. 21SJ11W-1]
MQARQRTTTIITLCVLTAAAVMGSYFLRAAIHQQLQAELEHRLLIANNAMHRWRDTELRQVSTWAQHPRVAALVQALLDADTQSPPGNSAAKHDALKTLFTPFLRVSPNRGFIVIRPDKTLLSADRPELIGLPSPLVSQPHAFQQALAGEAVITHPMRADLPLKNRAGRSVSGWPTQFGLAPIANAEGEIIALLGLRIDVLADFTPLLSQLNFGQSGEVIMFNRAGKLLSESRFLNDLPALGLTQRSTSVLELSLLDPLRDLRERPKGLIEPADLPLTQTVQSAIANGRGANLSGYRDYRGITVVGAWLWDDELNLGFGVKMDAEEALHSYHLFMWVLLLITGISVVIILYLTITDKLSKQKIKQYYREKSSILDNTPAFIYIRDLHGRVLFANSEAADVFGFDRRLLPLWAAEQSASKHLPFHRELLSQRHQLFIDQEDDVLLRDKDAFTYEAMLQDDTKKRTFIITKFPIRNDRGVIYAIGTSGIDITQRLETEQQLNERDRFQANLMGNLPGAVYRCKLGPTGWEITYISHGSIELLGKSSSTLIEQQTTFFKDIVFSEDRARTNERIRSSLTSGLPYQLEFRLANTSPTKWLWARGRIFEVNGEVITEGFLSDITERKNVEEELAAHRRQLSSLVTERTRELDRERERLNDIIRGAADGIISCNNLYTITLYSPAAQLLLGYSQEDAIGRSIFECFSPANAKLLRADLELLDNMEPPQAAREIDLIHQSGQTVRAEISISRNTTHGLVNYTFILRDVTVRLEQQQALETAKRVAEEANQAKSNFLANISHEIRTPLNAIIGMNQLALRTKLDGKQSRYLKTIEYSSHTLLGIINDVLDFSKIEAGKLEIENIPFNLESSLEAISQMTALRAQEKGVDFLLDIDPRVPANLYGDPLRISQILTNLCSNATKFTERGHITLGTKFVRAESAQVTLEFFVADTGIGLTQDQQAQLFKAFSQADASVTRKYGGTGLGLSICKELVNLMGGSILVESQPNRGSRFSFQLTFTCDEEHGTQARGPDQLRGLSILLVETEAQTTDILQLLLGESDHQLVTCQSGEQALVKLNDGQKFDIVLLDWQQSGVAGTDLITQIDAASNGQRPPIIVMLNAEQQAQSSDMARDAGADALLFKPVSGSELWDALTQLTLPANNRKLARPSAITSLSVPEKFRGARILIVEDNDINQEIAREIFETAGFDVSLAGDGQAAVNKVTQHTFDLVLMDIQMPVMDGESATQLLRAKGYTLPIIAMTANAFRDDEQRCLSNGMNAYLTKPINIENALATVCHWLAKHGCEAPATSHTGTTEPHIDQTAAAAVFNHTDNTLPGLDTRRGLTNCTGNEELYLRLLEDFVASYQDLLPSLDQLLQAQLYHKAHQLTHSLKGVSGNLGAQRVYEACTQLDNNLRKAKPELAKIPAQFFSLTKAWEQLLNNLKTLGVNTTADVK